MPDSEPRVSERVETLRVNGLDHAVHRFELVASAAVGRRRTILLLHGFLDAAATFELLAVPLAQAGYEVVAPDFRGFGESARVPEGGYYHFPDYVADVDGLVNALAPTWLGVVGHSMGGSVATLFAGTRPERVAKLVVMEGLGPASEPPEAAPGRMRKWLADLARIERAPRPLASLDEALTRLAATHPRIDRAILASRAERLVARSPSGELRWAWDPLHRSTSPTPFNTALYGAFLREIRCPTLFIHGGPLGWHPPDEQARLADITQLEQLEIADAGHMMHWTAPAEVARAILRFFDDHPVAKS